MYTPKPEEVTAALSDVFYEIEVLLWATEQTYMNRSVTPALLESRLLHTRNLIHFFEHETKARKEDDVLAEDYRFPPRKVGISKLYRNRLNKSLSHITYKRVTFRAQGIMEWPIKDTLLPLLDPCEEFLQYLTDRFLRKENAVDKRKASCYTECIKRLRHIINTKPEPVHPV